MRCRQRAARPPQAIVNHRLRSGRLASLPGRAAPGAARAATRGSIRHPDEGHGSGPGDPPGRLLRARLRRSARRQGERGACGCAEPDAHGAVRLVVPARAQRAPPPPTQGVGVEYGAGTAAGVPPAAHGGADTWSSVVVRSCPQARRRLARRLCRQRVRRGRGGRGGAARPGRLARRPLRSPWLTIACGGPAALWRHRIRQLRRSDGPRPRAASASERPSGARRPCSPAARGPHAPGDSPPASVARSGPARRLAQRAPRLSRSPREGEDGACQVGLDPRP